MNSSYVLVTAARNEESFIARTIDSVILQTVLPRKWVIVSDGSTDRTDSIVRDYCKNYHFIDFLRRERVGQRNFGGKADAIKMGVDHLKNTEYGFVGNLDADVTFGQNYFECLLEKFYENPKLGLCGGSVVDCYNNRIHKRVHYQYSIPGAVQFFRRECYEDIGGYISIETGGIDTIAEVMARMKGWKTKTFSELSVLHHRRDGTKGNSNLVAMFHAGYRDCMFGHDPIFHLLKCVWRSIEKPFVLCSACRMVGYISAFMRCFNNERQVPDDFVSFLRAEQKKRMKLTIEEFYNYVTFLSKS